MKWRFERSRTLARKALGASGTILPSVFLMEMA
jgi:hypothetical protein